MSFDWGEAIARTIDRGLNAAVDITIARETPPGFVPNTNQPTATLQPATPTTPFPATVGGIDSGVLMLVGLVVGVVVLVKFVK